MTWVDIFSWGDAQNLLEPGLRKDTRNSQIVEWKVAWATLINHAIQSKDCPVYASSRSIWLESPRAFQQRLPLLTVAHPWPGKNCAYNFSNGSLQDTHQRHHDCWTSATQLTFHAPIGARISWSSVGLCHCLRWNFWWGQFENSGMHLASLGTAPFWSLQRMLWCKIYHFRLFPSSNGQPTYSEICIAPNHQDFAPLPTERARMKGTGFGNSCQAFSHQTSHNKSDE